MHKDRKKQRKKKKKRGEERKKDGEKDRQMERMSERVKNGEAGMRQRGCVARDANGQVRVSPVDECRVCASALTEAEAMCSRAPSSY